MSRWKNLLVRLDRVLSLSERLLEERLGVSPGPDVFARHEAFRWDVAAGTGRLVPIPGLEPFDLEDLLGVERPVGELLRNTQQFLRGFPANHVLLYGERGTGKSSAVRGLVSRFAGQGLRIVEIRKEELLHLPRVLAAVRGLPYRVLLFCDDLSFGEGEVGYRELKAALEGSLEAPPENVRIVATSNRRHLMPERRSENQQVRLDADGELHPGEALDEKLALSDRFGLVLGFFGFDQPTYLRIVEHHAQRAGISVAPDRLHGEALRWALDHSSRSGRTARQFVQDLAGRLALEATA